MPMPPAPDKRAKTGSNVRGRKALAALQREFKAKVSKITREQRAWRARFRKLFSKADVRVAAELIAQTRHGLRVANLKSGSATAAWDENKLRARKRLERELTRALPGYREWRGQLRAKLRAPAGAGPIAFAPGGLDIHVDIDDVAPVNPGVMVFTPPFGNYEVISEWAMETTVSTPDRSFALPDIGHFVNDFEFTLSDDGAVREALGINVRASVLAWAACGIHFRVPAQGRLKMTALVRNFFNRILLSVRDQVGFSEATLEVGVDLYIDLLIDENIVESLHTPLLTKRITSGGGEHTYLMPDLDTQTPYGIEATSALTYDLGQKIEILVGCRIAVDSEIDDMTTHVRPLLWWKLEELTVEMVNYPIL
jgi:hypothetical protein